jgi:type IV pilus assembly protein PilN
MQQPDNAQLLNQAEFLNERFDDKAFSWTLAMEAMETVLPAGVQVTAIEPERTKDGQITVQLRVLGPHDQSVNLVRNLEHSRRFVEPRIESESAENSNTGPNQPQGPVSLSNRFEFELFADYNPPTPEERADLRNQSSQSAAPHSERHSPATAISPHPHAFPAAPARGGRPPFTGTVQMKPHPAPASNGGPR